MKNFAVLPRYRHAVVALLVSSWLAACSSAPSNDSASRNYPDPNAGRYAQDKDSIPLRLPTPEEMADPDPFAEPLSRGGNKPYNIYGVDYSPLTDTLHYNETGTASWYGSKFHGHLTSNGETYNVFSMTAAHKTLPLPSYVRVTNLDNQRTAIVRVNDRGPFHDGRIIDLSYSAAYKLGIFPGGTGRVRVELIASPAMIGKDSFATPIAREPQLPSANDQGRSGADQFVERPYSPTGSVASTSATPNPSATRPSSNASQPAITSNATARSNGCFIQLIASSDQAKVQRLGNEISQSLSVPVAVETVNGLFRLLAGPLPGHRAQQVLDSVRSGQYPNAYFSNKNLCG